MRKFVQDYLSENNISIKSGDDVNSVMPDMMSVLLEGTQDRELDEQLGCSKYDYRNNKDVDGSRNGHSRKAMHTTAMETWKSLSCVIGTATTSHS